MRGPPSPYRVLAFALECGDRPLATLLASRLFPAPSTGTPAAFLTVARVACALGLS